MSIICFQMVSSWTWAVVIDVRDVNDRPLDNAVVFFESNHARGRVRPLENAEMSQAQKEFAPRVLVVPVGTAVHFPNRDTVRHHVYSFSPTKKFELKLYIGTPAKPVTFDQSGVVVLGCNIHDHMVGWILVVDTPHYAVSGSNGHVTLDLPTGSYRLRAWHPDLPVGAPATDQPIAITGGDQRITVRIPGVRR